MAPNIVETPFTITDITSGVTLNSTATTASVWGKLADYQVPLGMAFITDATNYLYLSPYSSAATPAAITTGVARLLKLNAPQTQSKEIWSGPVGIFYNIGDEKQRPRLKTSVLVNASEWLRWEIYSTTAAKGSVSTFSIEGRALYAPI